MNGMPDMEKASYFIRLGGALSRFGNTVIFNGHPSETISGRCWRLRLERPGNRWWWRLCRVVNVLFFWQENHCKVAYLTDISYASDRVFRHENL